MTTIPAVPSLLLGFPSALSKRLISKLLQQPGTAPLYVLLEEQHLAQWRSTYQTFSKTQQQRARALVGGLHKIDLGLSGQECNQIFHEVQHIYALTGLDSFRAKRRQLQKANVHATRAILHFAREFVHLDRLLYGSSLLVTGKRQGVILEDELPPARFANPLEESKWQAEHLVRQYSQQLPISIVRPAWIAEHSQAKQTNLHFEGLYHLFQLFLAWPFSFPQQFSLGEAPLHIVPLDFVADAILLVAKKGSPGKTYHIHDPNSLSMRQVFEQIAQRGRENPLHRNLALQGLTQLARYQLSRGFLGSLISARQLLEQFNCFQRHLILDRQNMDELLQHSQLECPPFHSYVDEIVEFLFDYQMNLEHSSMRDVEDSLDSLSSRR